MADYQRLQQRFYLKGFALTPQDSLPDGVVGYVRNMRSYQTGTVEPRYGLTAVTANAFNFAVHSVFRINDTTSFAPAPALRIAGVDSTLARGSTAVPTNYTVFDSNFSGNPLTAVIAAPLQSSAPWLYIGDSRRTRKVSVAGVHGPIGVTQPATFAAAPGAIVNQLAITLLDNDADLADWHAVGPIADPVTVTGRVNTQVNAIVYDNGSTGWASVLPDSFDNIIGGTRLDIDPGGSGETFVVMDVHPPVANTTIARIIYDSGNHGPCTIQPVASLAVGQLETASYEDARQRYYRPQPTVPTAAKASTIRPVDFPVNSLIRLGSTELVRVLSVAVGQDGVQSFRCDTGGNWSAGSDIEGVSSFRAYFLLAHTAGDQLLALVPQQTLTNPSATDPGVGGMQNLVLHSVNPALGTDAVNAAIVGTPALGFTPRATTPDDDIYLAFKADNLIYINEVRFYLNVDPTKDFLRNYYMHAWRANDLVSAIQSTNAQVTATVQDARVSALEQNQVDLLVQQYGPAIATAIAQGTLSLQDYPLAGVTATTPGGAAAIGLSATSQQLALGNNTWIALRCKVRDLIRVGLDSTLTLGSVNAVQLLVMTTGTTSPITVQYADFYMSGGYGPDVRETAEPYSYCYRGRSSITGERGNPSPPSRGGVIPRRQAVTVTGRQVVGAGALGGAPVAGLYDRVDWFKRGGLLTGWTYFGTTDNTSAPTITDVVNDAAIDGGESLRFDLFQPWPIADIPASGTCTAAGTAIQRTSGTLFNPAWAPGTQVLVNGVAATLYCSPVNTNLLHLNENVGAGINLTFTVPEPVLLAQPLPSLWGGTVDGVVFLFACGDQSDPGALHWSHGNDPDATSDRNVLIITSASEPLMNGGMYNNSAPFVLSSANYFSLVPTFGDLTTFHAVQTPCGKGLWSRWAMCVAPDGVYFLADDGIYRTVNGSPAVSITTPDLAPIFPREGALGETTRGIVPPDMTRLHRLRLTWVGRYIYFDYEGIDGHGYTLIFDRLSQGWLFDRYDLTAITSRHNEGTEQSEAQILGGNNGQIFQYDATKISDAGTGISWSIWTGHLDASDARAIKQFGDVMLDCLPGATLNGFTITPVADNGLDILSTVVGAAATTRTQYIVDLASGAGVLSRNLGLRVDGLSNLCDLHRPLLYLWGPTYLPKPELLQARATDWDTLGVAGAKLIRGVTIRANTYNQAKQLQVQYDGGTVAQTITITANGEKAIPFALAPFYANLVRLYAVDALPWFVLPDDIQWTVDPKPQLIPETSSWDDGGTIGAKQVRGLVIHVHTNGVAGLPLQVQMDDGVVVTTLGLGVSAGEDGQGFSFNPPFLAHLMRLVPLGAMRIIARQWIFDAKPELTAQYTDWSNTGSAGVTSSGSISAKFVQGIKLQVDTGGAAVPVQIQIDNGVVAATVLLQPSTGEDTQVFSFDPTFIAHIWRLVPLGNVRILSAELVFEPTPEAALVWETQYTTHDLPGFLSVLDGVIAYVSTTPIVWTIEYQDGTLLTYILDSSGGNYRRFRQIVAASKGKAVRYRWSAAAPFQLFKKDCAVRVVGWGQPALPGIYTPFGGPSRADGAAI